MIFLIEYRRSAGKLLRLATFNESARAEAERQRVDLELAHRNEGDYEVVVLEAESEEALRRTHGRYFEAFAT